MDWLYWIMVAIVLGTAGAVIWSIVELIRDAIESRHWKATVLEPVENEPVDEETAELIDKVLRDLPDANRFYPYPK
jgi:hypothetical protein